MKKHLKRLRELWDKNNAAPPRSAHFALQVYPDMPEDIRERNKEVETAYHNIVEAIRRIQKMALTHTIRVETNYLNSNRLLATIYQCTTPFCVVSLGCNEIGVYTLIYSLDYRLMERLDQYEATILLHRIHMFMGYVRLNEAALKMHSNAIDCDEVLGQVIHERNEDDKIIIESNEEAIQQMAKELPPILVSDMYKRLKDNYSEYLLYMQEVNSHLH